MRGDIDGRHRTGLHNLRGASCKEKKGLEVETRAFLMLAMWGGGKGRPSGCGLLEVKWRMCLRTRVTECAVWCWQSLRTENWPFTSAVWVQVTNDLGNDLLWYWERMKAWLWWVVEKLESPRLCCHMRWSERKWHRLSYFSEDWVVFLQNQSPKAQGFGNSK